jgi:uncharacterized protein
LRLLTLLPLVLLLLRPTFATAEPIQIDGPHGPLMGDALTAANARHVVVILPGSGPTDRDGNAVQMGWRAEPYKLLAEDLKAAGVSSVRIDKRGFHASEAAISDPRDITIGGYAEDARKWVDRASALAPCVWLAGHSEGGLVALVAAQTPPKPLCGLILMATPGRPAGQLLIEQFRANPATTALAPDVEAMVADLEAGRSRDPKSLPPALQPLFSSGLQRYMIDLFSYDPVAVAKRWHGPTLILQGDADFQVRPRDAELLAAALPQATRVDLPGATHMLKQDVPGKPFATYGHPALPLHPDVIPSITRFLKQGAGSD